MNSDNFLWDQKPFREFILAEKDKLHHRPGPGFVFIKRLFDLGASFFGLLLLLPLFPFIVLLISLESSGPIFFRQIRVGKGGRLFPCYKFRSMAVDAEQQKEKFNHLNEATGAAFKIRSDPRVTGVGRFLRRSSLDEFPQLLNVLLGQMSIVGPRPQIPSEVIEYTPEQACRLLVKPGLTCLWQVSGRSHLEFSEWMRLDLEYVKNQGLLSDFRILFRTLPAVIERKGAY